jgi:hypothetical protein
MPYVAQNLILEPWTILDVNSNPLTGMTSPADITFSLKRQSGSTFVAASEVVGFAESAVAGTYAITVTPQNTGTYINELKELNVGTLQRTWRFVYEVLPAGAVFSPSFANAFCAETDIERYLGLSFTATSQVTSTQAAGFAEERAAYIMAMCAAWGSVITPSSVIPGSRLEDLLRAANAIGAAFDAAVSWYTQVEPAENEKARLLMARWVSLMGDGEKLVGLIETEIETNLTGGFETDNVLSGDTIARNTDIRQDVGLLVRMDDLS